MAVAVPATAQTTLTGNWSGNYSYSIQVSACQNKTFTSNGSVTFTLLQIGHAIQGRADFSNFLIFSGNCNPAKGEVTTVSPELRTSKTKLSNPGLKRPGPQSKGPWSKAGSWSIRSRSMPFG